MNLWSSWRLNPWSLTLMSSKSKLFRMMLFRFQMIGGLKVPWMAQLSTALWPTVAAVTLSFWSSGRLSWMTSAKDTLCFMLISRQCVYTLVALKFLIWITHNIISTWRQEMQLFHKWRSAWDSIRLTDKDCLVGREAFNMKWCQKRRRRTCHIDFKVCLK